MFGLERLNTTLIYSFNQNNSDPTNIGLGRFTGSKVQYRISGRRGCQVVKWSSSQVAKWSSGQMVRWSGCWVVTLM